MTGHNTDCTGALRALAEVPSLPGRRIALLGAGGVAPLVGASIIAWATVHWGGHEGTLLAWIPLASYVAILSLIGVVTTYFTPETRGRDLDDLRDAADAPMNGFAATKLAEES